MKKIAILILLITMVGGLTGCPPTQTIMRGEKKDEGGRKTDTPPKDKTP